MFILIGTILPVNDQVKVLILLFFAALMVLFTIICDPYCQSHLNTLELRSNISILMIVFSATLFLFKCGEIMKVLFMIVIFYISLSFIMKWINEVLEIFVFIHYKKISKICPIFLKFYEFLKSISLKQMIASFFKKGKKYAFEIRKNRKKKDLSIKPIFKKKISL